jgi:glycine betaine/proline transport system permease protein/glycine betaine/proline transport system substrate-binding protein
MKHKFSIERGSSMKNKFLLMGLLVTVLLIFTAGCSSAAPVKIVVMDQTWDSQKFHSKVARFIVENGFDGYVVEEIGGSWALLWPALIAGDIDLDIEEWTDNIFTYQDDLARGDVVEAGVIVEDSAQGFYVPRYVVEGDPERGIEPMAPDLKTVEDLKKFAHVFKDPEDRDKGRIYGPIPSWPIIDEVMYKKYQYYGLDEGYNYFRCGSETALFASLSSAYNLGEPWVGYCYEPAWISGKLDLIMLSDVPFDPELYPEGKCEIPKQELKIVSSNIFASRAPDLVDFFSKYKTGSKRVSEVLAYMDETRASHEEAAIWFLKKNEDLLDEWLTPEQAERVRSALAGV